MEILFQLFELGEERAVAHARLGGQLEAVRDGANVHQDRARRLVLEHHHPHRVAHRPEKRDRSIAAEHARLLQRSDERKEDLLLLHHVRDQIVTQPIDQRLHEPKLVVSPAVHAAHLGGQRPDDIERIARVRMVRLDDEADHLGQRLAVP